MFTLNGIRNAFYCALAFGIVACASATAPMADQADVDAQLADPTARATERKQPVGEAACNEPQTVQAQGPQGEAEARRLAAQLEDMQVSQTARGIVLTLQDVLFNTGRAQLKPGAERSLDQVALFLNRHPERRLQIEGFTDSEGTDDYNIELSQSRADTVAMAIIQRGIDARRMRAMGYGEQYPKASNTNAGSRQLNRRVEIVVSNGEQAIPVRTATGAS